MEKLSREEAIRLHREMWNWIADENEKGNDVDKWLFLIKEGFIESKDLEVILESDEYKIDCYCFCCEYAKQKADENGEEYDYRCKYCPLEWGNANKDLLFMCCDHKRENDDEGLYCLWNDEDILPIEKAKYARQIANLPERKESEIEINV